MAINNGEHRSASAPPPPVEDENSTAESGPDQESELTTSLAPDTTTSPLIKNK